MLWNTRGRKIKIAENKFMFLVILKVIITIQYSTDTIDSHNLMCDEGMQQWQNVSTGVFCH